MEYYEKNKYIKIILINKYKIIIIIKIFQILILILFLLNKYFININSIKENNFINNARINKKFIFTYIKNYQINTLYLNVTYIKFYYSLIYNKVKIEYNIGAYDNNRKLIKPSDLSLYNNIHLLCRINIINSNEYIHSLPNIDNNKYFQCIEFYNLNENINFGIKVYFLESESKIQQLNIYFSKENFNFFKITISNNDNIFNPILIQNKYTSTIKKMNKKRLNEKNKLQKSYFIYPYCNLKRKIAVNNNKWFNSNIYNHYFCYCKGEKCLFNEITQMCKYNFYHNVIDNNKYIYKKTEYLFSDFIFADQSSDDTFPVFQTMVTKNSHVHYITENMHIYNDYCFDINKCQTIIKIDKDTYPLFGDFLENYLTLLLKTKAVISGKVQAVNLISKLFYDIDYITYIAVGHGLCYFKDYLYAENRLYGIKMNDKILIPPSKKIISIAKKYGWKDKNIIKLNLPRWDRFSYYNETINNKSIFIMLTWRRILLGQSVSSYYKENITNLLLNNELIRYLEKYNITLYYTYHRLLPYRFPSFKISRKNKFSKLILQNEISDILAHTDLIISDFSSVIFDLIYRRKPFIIYIPDANDEQLEYIYAKEYVDLINLMKNGTIKFENKFFDFNDVINKIIYYISNNFKLEPELEKFYDSFELNKEGKIINTFIEYLNNLN